MIFPRSADGFFEALAELSEETSDTFATELLRRALGHKSNHVVARASGVAVRLKRKDLEADLMTAFERFLKNGAETDKGCAAKNAVVGALERLELGTAELFRRGARHRQMEPVFGGREDTAVTLRSACGVALVRLAPWDLPLELARLLADPEFRVRENAARALGDCRHPAAAPLLLHKAFADDAEPSVVGECLRGLITIDANTHLETVAGFLRARDVAVRELAALALGESRLGSAFPPLREMFDRAHGSNERACALLALGSLRREEGFRFLAEIGQTGEVGDAEAALRALRISAGTPEVDGLIAEIGAARPELS